ncbi:MAG: glycine C-acetyltransferase [Proteobacteria bacterium]|nr:glycine C-acetyltransferase [Pseudomonadota bacterium]
MLDEFRERLRRDELALEKEGLLKRERVIDSAQGPTVRLADGRELINLCDNNYLGLANHPEVCEAAHHAIDRYGYGMASVRFICGTQSVHRDLEERLSAFLGVDDAILYSSCFDANGGLFETLLDEQDAVISDALNHASIIDGIRLCKARRLRYANDDLDQLEQALKDSRDARVRLIATDGVFSMDGSIARLRQICDLADRYGALVMVDDSHATGFMGATGRGTHEYCDVMDRIDILTGTLGKALGGASGGYVAARREIVAWLRQRSRPYLFSNSLAPVVAATTLRVLELLESSADLRSRLHANASRFRSGLAAHGFELVPGEHPIIPVMLGDARVAGALAERLLALGVYVVAFSFPVVPRDKARIRTQMNAAHDPDQLDRAIAAFSQAARDIGLHRGKVRTS